MAAAAQARHAATLATSTNVTPGASHKAASNRRLSVDSREPGFHSIAQHHPFIHFDGDGGLFSEGMRPEKSRPVFLWTA